MYEFSYRKSEDFSAMPQPCGCLVTLRQMIYLCSTVSKRFTATTDPSAFDSNSEPSIQPSTNPEFDFNQNQPSHREQRERTRMTRFIFRLVWINYGWVSGDRDPHENRGG